MNKLKIKLKKLQSTSALHRHGPDPAALVDAGLDQPIPLQLQQPREQLAAAELGPRGTLEHLQVLHGKRPVVGGLGRVVDVEVQF